MYTCTRWIPPAARLRHSVCPVSATGSQSPHFLSPGHATSTGGTDPLIPLCTHRRRDMQTRTLQIPPVTSLRHSGHPVTGQCILFSLVVTDTHIPTHTLSAGLQTLWSLQQPTWTCRPLQELSPSQRSTQESTPGLWPFLYLAPTPHILLPDQFRLVFPGDCTVTQVHSWCVCSPVSAVTGTTDTQLF